MAEKKSTFIVRTDAVVASSGSRLLRREGEALRRGGKAALEGREGREEVSLPRHLRGILDPPPRPHRRGSGWVSVPVSRKLTGSAIVEPERGLPASRWWARALPGGRTEEMKACGRCSSSSTRSQNRGRASSATSGAPLRPRGCEAPESPRRRRRATLIDAALGIAATAERRVGCELLRFSEPPPTLPEAAV